ncbi:MAG: glycosyltransferase family 4 protein [Alphaproteobacteria bacterium]
MTKRVLLFINDMSGGGAQNGIATLFKYGFLQQAEVTVVALIRGDGLALPAFEQAGVKVHILYDSPTLRVRHMLQGLFGYAKIWLKVKPQLVILSLAQANMIGRVVGMVLRSRLVVFEHSVNYGKLIYGKILKLLSLGLWGSVADCKETLTATKQFYLRPAHMLGWDIPLAIVQPQPAHPQVLHSPVRLVSAGRLAPEKNFGAVVQALAMLKAQNIAATWTVFGQGPEMENLMAQAAHLGVVEQITLAGYHPQWASQLKEHDVYVQPSLREGLSITTIEAMATGIPVIASPVGGIPSYSNAGEHFMAIDPHDATTLASAITELVKNPKQAARMGNAAQSHIVAQFGEDTARATIADVSRQLLNV